MPSAITQVKRQHPGKKGEKPETPISPHSKTFKSEGSSYSQLEDFSSNNASDYTHNPNDDRQRSDTDEADRSDMEGCVDDRYVLEAKLGKGAYGAVWSAYDNVEKERVALKKIFEAFRNKVDAQRTYREITFLMNFDHPNIISLLRVHPAIDNNDIYLVFPLMSGDLHKLISNDGQTTKSLKQSIIHQILCALKYLHSGEVIHRDLKPANILLMEGLIVKVADFGLARYLANFEESITLGGKPEMTDYVATRWYRPLEILLNYPRYTKAVDMWSVGCILGEMIVREPIFRSKSTIEQIEVVLGTIKPPNEKEIKEMCIKSPNSITVQMIEKASQQRRKSIREMLEPFAVSSDALDFIQQLLVFSPSKRMTVEEALNHPFISPLRNPSEETIMENTLNPALNDHIMAEIDTYRDEIFRMFPRNDLLRVSSTCATRGRSPENGKFYEQTRKTPIDEEKKYRGIHTIQNQKNSRALKQSSSEGQSIKDKARNESENGFRPKGLTRPSKSVHKFQHEIGEGSNFNNHHNLQGFYKYTEKKTIEFQDQNLHEMRNHHVPNGKYANEGVGDYYKSHQTILPPLKGQGVAKRTSVQQSNPNYAKRIVHEARLQGLTLDGREQKFLPRNNFSNAPMLNANSLPSYLAELKQPGVKKVTGTDAISNFVSYLAVSNAENPKTCAKVCAKLSQQEAERKRVSKLDMNSLHGPLADFKVKPVDEEEARIQEIKNRYMRFQLPEKHLGPNSKWEIKAKTRYQPTNEQLRSNADLDKRRDNMDLRRKPLRNSHFDEDLLGNQARPNNDWHYSDNHRGNNGDVRIRSEERSTYFPQTCPRKTKAQTAQSCHEFPNNRHCPTQPLVIQHPSRFANVKSLVNVRNSSAPRGQTTKQQDIKEIMKKHGYGKSVGSISSTELYDLQNFQLHPHK